MKYKVILYNAGSSQETDLAGNFTFYTLNSAIHACTVWVAIGDPYLARLWDGSVWRLYT